MLGDGTVKSSSISKVNSKNPLLLTVSSNLKKYPLFVPQEKRNITFSRKNLLHNKFKMIMFIILVSEKRKKNKRE